MLTPLTDDQTTALRSHLERTADLMRRFIDAFAEIARRHAVPAMRAVTAFLRAFEDRAPAPDPLGLTIRSAARTQRPVRPRPAWASPYGPAPRRTR